MNCIISRFLLGLMTSLVLAINCPYQECDCEGNETLCNFRDLKDIPHKLFNNSPSLTSLNVDGNQITTIPAGSLPGNLSSISFQGNPIEAIDNTAFDESIYTLQEVSFSAARFTQIPEAVFHLKTLKKLEIDQTNILVWNEDGMNQFGSTMGILNLNTVGLTSWPTWMKSMTNLTELSITGCSISTIPDDALDKMANSLTSLQLSSNGLTKLPKSMSKLTILKVLTLSYNKIIDVTWLPQSNHLTGLYLNNNKITDSQKLSNVLKLSANTLSSFDIQNNSLTSIPELSFLTQIWYLNFAYNHLSNVNSGSLPSNLTELDFENNLLSSVPSTMNNLNQLIELFLSSNNIQIVQGSYIPICVQVLDLSFNSISQLTRSSFPSNSSLTLLTLSYNPLSTISPDAFSNIPLLTQLNLQSTKLLRLPLAIASLTKLHYLDVSDSKSLVCTCQEQSLRSWVKSISSYSIYGECGVTSIYFFFVVLSPECPQI